MPKSLHDEIRDGNIDQVKVLIAQGANVNEIDSMRRTPLVIAAWRGNSDIIRILLSANADSNIKAMDNFTPLHFAAQGGHTESVKLIGKKNKTILNARISKGQKSALHIAAGKGYVDVVKMLVSLGADVDAKTSSGQTAADLSQDQEIKRILDSSTLTSSRDEDGGDGEEEDETSAPESVLKRDRLDSNIDDAESKESKRQRI